MLIKIAFLALLYLMSFLDRVNIGNARLAGLEHDLNLRAFEYNWALSIFFAGYIMFELPANIILRAWRPSRWITLIVCAWGSITMCLAAVTNAQGLLVCRFLLGLTEAGLFPALLYLLPLWYTKRELAVRIALFFGSSTVAGAFGGFLAYGITQMDGLGRLRGWQWLFIIEGGFTVLLAGACWFLLPDGPESAWFLTKAERIMAVERMPKKMSREIRPPPRLLATLRSVLTDWKIPMHCIIGLCGTPMYALAFFLPSIIRGMGYSNLSAQAMSSAPYAVGLIVLLAVSWSSDRRQERGLHVALPMAAACLGFVGLALVSDVRVKYALAVFTTAALFSHIPPVLSWMSGNFAGHGRRAIALATIQSIANIGGIASGMFYVEKDAPKYVQGHIICATLCGTSVLLCLIMKSLLVRANNRKRDIAMHETPRLAFGHILDADDDRNAYFTYMT